MPSRRRSPEEWLRLVSALHLTEEDKARIEELGGWEKIMETLKKRLDGAEGAATPAATNGSAPAAPRRSAPTATIPPACASDRRKAATVARSRCGTSASSRTSIETVEIGTRNIKVALRRLRSFARTGAAEELDLSGTIRGTAEKGYLDIRMVPERHNTVKVLMFFDVGGSMDWHIKGAEELFSAARSEFKHLEYYYFHNCLYEQVWKHNARRRSELISTWDVLHTYPADYKVIFIGDASMSPYELTHVGGAVEHMNPEPGALWLRRVTETYSIASGSTRSPSGIGAIRRQSAMIRDMMEGRMYPLTLGGPRPGDGRADALTALGRK